MSRNHRLSLRTVVISSIRKPQLVVPVASSDHHAMQIISTYGGLLTAALNDKSIEDRLKRYYMVMGLDLINVGAG